MTKKSNQKDSDQIGNPFSSVSSEPNRLQTSLLQTAFYRVDDNGFAGYVVSNTDLTRRYVVELFLDGYALQVARADAFVEELGRAAVGDGCYGFYFTLPIATLGDGFVLEARLANNGTVLGQPIELHGSSLFGTDPRGPGQVQWLGGLRFEGWYIGESDELAEISVIIDGETVARVLPTRWTHIGDIENAEPVRAFDLHLPQRFADGRVRRAQFLLNDTQELPGSPSTFVAYTDGLEETLARLGKSRSEMLRAKQFDRLMPQSLPFSSYREWQDRFPLPVTADTKVSIAVVMVGPGPSEKTLQSLRSQPHVDWVAAEMPEGPGRIDFNHTDLSAFLSDEATGGDIVLFALTGTHFIPNVLQRFVSCFASYPQASAVYADVDIETENGATWPLAFSAFDYERMLEQGYCAHLFAMRRAAVERGLNAGASNFYRLFNSLFDNRVNDQVVVHLPGTAGTLPRLDISTSKQALATATSAHLNARGINASVEPSAGTVLPAVRVMRATRKASVSIIIPVRNKPNLLKACLNSILPALQNVDAELIIVDNDSSDPEMLEFLRQLDETQALVLRLEGAFNFSRLNNIAAQKAHTDQLLLMNNDVEALEVTWLEEMQGRISEADVAAVGALLLWPSRVVQHGGVILGPSFAATHAFNDRMEGDPGYCDLLRVARSGSAVTAACMLVSRNDYLNVGGMDELHFPVNFNDVDLCLKFRASGKRVIFTPHAKLLHLESSTRGRDAVPDRAMRYARELAVLRARWGDVLANDPYYSPILSLDPIPFSALAWPPRERAPRVSISAQPKNIPSGF
jgi:GT2 family glycosyltransferase